MTIRITELTGLEDVSRETNEKLEAFQALTLKWTKSINLISSSSKSNIWFRHIVDSAQIFPLAEGLGPKWVDIGSGGGYPAIVLAVLSQQLAPERNFHLVESDQRKAAFLRTAARELDVPVVVISKRIEDLEPLRADILTARALASLDKLLGIAETHLSPKGRAIFPKGKAAADEIRAAKAGWTFDLSATPSMTDAEASLLCIERISRA